MKKIFFILLLLIPIFASARESVKIVYGWGPGDTAADFNRKLVSVANKIQTKYHFEFLTRPGAGGSIAVNYADNNKNSIILHSSAFFIRPIMYPKSSYVIDHYQDLLLECKLPMTVNSKKYTSWQKIPTNKSITIGITGIGSTTHLVALQIMKKYPKIKIIPYKGPSKALLALIKGEVDLSIGFVSQSIEYQNQIHVLGLTGDHSYNNFPLLIDQGFPKTLAETDVIFQLIIPNSVDSKKIIEWKKILERAGKSEDVKKGYKLKFCDPEKDNNDPQVFNRQKILWDKLTKDVKKIK